MNAILKYSSKIRCYVLFHYFCMALLSSCMTISRPSPPTIIKSFKGDDYVVFQMDSVRLYIPRNRLTDSLETLELMHSSQLGLRALISKGILTGEMFFESYKQGSKNRITIPRSSPVKTIVPLPNCSRTFEDELYTFTGPRVTIWWYSTDTTNSAKIYKLATSLHRFGEFMWHYTLEIKQSGLVTLKYEGLDI